MAAPTITSAELSVGVALAATTVSCIVTWTGEPRVEPEFQWFDGPGMIPGATLPSFLPPVDMPALVCRVTVDNGHGFATAVARLEPVAVDPTDPDPPDPIGPLYATAGYFTEGYA